MTALGWNSVPAAVAITGFSVAHVAGEAGIDEAVLQLAIDGDDVLPSADRARLRAFLWRYGVVMLDLPGCDGALCIDLVVELRACQRSAEYWPDFTTDLFARAWRAWLRLSGQGGRIRKVEMPAND